MAFVFTPENLLDNLEKLGPWSAYGLAEEAIHHYHPEISEIEDTLKRIQAQAAVSPGGWHDWIVKYHKEVGYEGPFNPGAVNEN